MSDTDSKNFEITNSNSPMMESGDEDDFVLVKVRPPLPLLYPKLPTTTTHNHQSERKNEEVGLEHKIPNSIERDGQQKKLLTPMNHRKSITKVILAACILTTVLTVVTNRFGKVLKPSGLIIPLTSYVTNVMVRTKAPPIRQLPNIQHSNNIRSSTCERIQPILLLHPVRWPLISAFSSSQEQRIELERPMVGPLVHSGWFPRRPSSSPPHFKPLAKVVTSLVQKGYHFLIAPPLIPTFRLETYSCESQITRAPRPSSLITNAMVSSPRSVDSC